ncbi:condensation domain-containing protein [Kibdelosporangium philippinense]|uniref:Condensation domain-containing protein n=3 Tax=Kibdelosporangium philippinense TaxID=211113 RepID=A0ABS8ZA18_9PSEU|nr:condensation domain-containing protein [Kibdelosporangium philippinense]MCE7004709.1 condensation domain-containing protein [Kibdelosporangium philippinense]
MMERVTVATPDHIPVLDRMAGPLPVSGAQRALYLVELLHPGTPMYNITVAVRLEGPLDVPRLRSAVARVVARHDALRTTFTPGTAPPFEPAQRIGDPDAELPVVDLDADGTEDVDAAAFRVAQAWADEPFDLERGPLLRTRLLRLGPGRHLLVVTMHQLVSDGPSLQVFFDELAEGYAGGPERAAPALQFADYAAWQRARPVDAEQLGWWRDRLAGVPTVLRLPADRPRPAVAGPHGGSHRHRLRAAVMRPALRLAQDLRVTPFVLVLTAYATFLSRLAGTRDVLVGVPVSARDRVELESVIGFFATTLPVLVEAGRDRNFADLCRSVQSELLDVLTHRDVTMEQLAEELAPRRDPGHAPLVQAFFSLEQEPIVSPHLPGLRATAFDLPPTGAKVDLDMMVFRAAGAGDDFDLTLTYRTDLFEAATIARMAEQFELLLVAAVSDPTAPIRSLPGPVEDVPATSRPAAATVAPRLDLPMSACTGMEQNLIQIWREVLSRDDIGLDDNFFDLGGTSFALATVHTLIGARTGAKTSLVSLLEFPTIAALARHLADGPRTGPAPVEPADQARAARLRDRRNRLQQRRSARGAGE